MRFDVAIEIFNGNLFWDTIVDALLFVVFVFHRDVGRLEN